MRRSPIVDAHAHIFPNVRGYVGAGAVRHLGFGRVLIGCREVQALPPLSEKGAHTPDMLLAQMEWAGVDKAVLLQGPFYGEWNEYVAEALRRFPERFIGAAYLDPWAPDSDRVFDQIVTRTCFRAIKLECSEPTGLCGIHPETRLDMLEVAWLWRELEQRGLVLTVDLGSVASQSYQTGAVRAIAEEHPALHIVIAHLAQPTPTVEADPNLWQLWLEQMDLGRLPNVWFDTASLPAYAPQEDYPYPSARRYLRMALERIGPEKVLWGTDVPGLLLHATYRQLLRLARIHTEHLSPEEQSLVLGGNALRVYAGASGE